MHTGERRRDERGEGKERRENLFLPLHAHSCARVISISLSRDGKSPSRGEKHFLSWQRKIFIARERERESNATEWGGEKISPLHARDGERWARDIMGERREKERKRSWERERERESEREIVGQRESAWERGRAIGREKEIEGEREWERKRFSLFYFSLFFKLILFTKKLFFNDFNF